MHIAGSITGLDIAVTGLDDDALEIREAAFQGVLLALNAAWKVCMTMLSAQDHTLIELAGLGHPYSRKSGFKIHSPDELIHYQDGFKIAGADTTHYRDNLRRESPAGASDTITMGQIFNRDTQLDRWLQEGTTLMRARPWMKWIVENYGQDFADLIIARIDQAIAGRPASANTITRSPAA
jgi:hypothetical protein